MKHLHSYITTESDELAQPDAARELSLETSAHLFLQDFKINRPLLVQLDLAADDLKALMLLTHDSLAAIENRDGHFLGIVTIDDLSDQSLIRKQSQGLKRSDIKVADVMTKRKDLRAIAWSELAHASIADVITALKQMGCSECLVIDQEEHRIRGIFAISDISQKLGRTIEIHDQTNFYRVFAPVSCPG
jgi:CBS domain containing-hemolysin-like protein